MRIAWVLPAGALAVLLIVPGLQAMATAASHAQAESFAYASDVTATPVAWRQGSYHADVRVGLYGHGRWHHRGGHFYRPGPIVIRPYPYHGHYYHHYRPYFHHKRYYIQPYPIYRHHYRYQVPAYGGYGVYPWAGRDDIDEIEIDIDDGKIEIELDD